MENDVIHDIRYCNIILRLKDVTNTCKRMWHTLSNGGSSSVQWRNIGRSWRFQMFFRVFKIDQPQCVNCWVIIHCLLVSCTKINHSCCVLVIWSSLQLTSKQWIITQQFTTRPDLFLKHHLKMLPVANFSMRLKRIQEASNHGTNRGNPEAMSFLYKKWNRFLECSCNHEYFGSLVKCVKLHEQTKDQIYCIYLFFFL